jgi:hypothetical protein
MMLGFLSQRSRRYYGVALFFPFAPLRRQTVMPSRRLLFLPLRLCANAPSFNTKLKNIFSQRRKAKKIFVIRLSFQGSKANFLLLSFVFP